MKTLALAVLCLCALATCQANAIVPWMTTSFSDNNGFFAIHLTGNNPAGPQSFDFALNLTVGTFKTVKVLPGYAEYAAPLIFDVAGTFTSATGHIQTFTETSAEGGVDYQDYFAPNPRKAVYFYDYILTGNWGNASLETTIAGDLNDTVLPQGDPVTSEVSFTTITPEPSTLLMLGSGLVSAYSVFRLRRSRATASKDAS